MLGIHARAQDGVVDLGEPARRSAQGPARGRRGAHAAGTRLRGAEALIYGSLFLLVIVCTTHFFKKKFEYISTFQPLYQSMHYYRKFNSQKFKYH